MLVIDHLLGSLRGARIPVEDAVLQIGTGDDMDIHFPSDKETAVAEHHATLTKEGEHYRLSTPNGDWIAVNNKQVDASVVEVGDVIQIGIDGPVLRLRKTNHPFKSYKSMAEVVADCIECSKTIKTGGLDRATFFLSNAPRDFARYTAPAVKVLTPIIVLALVGTTVALFNQSNELQRQLRDQNFALEGLAQMAQSNAENEPTDENLAEIRAELEQAVNRVGELEDRSLASERVVAEVASSVAFVMGGYGFVGDDSKPLRLLLDASGKVQFDDDGAPKVTMEGRGPVFESRYSGTGFIAGESGHLVTNRHVALPWEYDDNAQKIIRQGYRPVMRKMIAYLPGKQESIDLTLVRAHEAADLAVLKFARQRGVELRSVGVRTTVARPGEEVFVLGYPTGMRSLIARTTPEFISKLEKDSARDFWTTAQMLADDGYIQPLATRGIVGQVSQSRVVYDAETTHGGSGGPVVSTSGMLVAVNAAILPEFGGSNLGVPTSALLEILD